METHAADLDCDVPDLLEVQDDIAIVASSRRPLTSVIIHQYSSQGILHLRDVWLNETLQHANSTRLFNMALCAQHAPKLPSAIPSFDRNVEGSIRKAPGPGTTKPAYYLEQQAKQPSSISGGVAAFMTKEAAVHNLAWRGCLPLGLLC
ncbi:hypothetical protein WJX84_004157 [Apatococcus fuscideae]|uniref:Uncharacterized protein n=1 Tax=Apatococcus fuscideae TaxID=2026836 RepID=A0AAW1T482_9CHLO